MALYYTNKHDVSLALAVFLMFDKYDYDDRPNSVSATGLIRPLRQLVLSQQNKELMKTVDISDLVASRMGSAIHDGCEEAWTDRENIAKALKVLGAGDAAIDSVRINPAEVKDGDIPVYVEQRAEKEIDNMVVTGKYDLVLDGTLNDYKSTSVWTYIYDSNAENYTKQGSIYKWLNPDKITSDYININYIFTDWSSAKARQDPKQYPQQRVLTKKYPLWGNTETENWILNKLAAYKRLANAAQKDLPECSDEELWASQTSYKYYKNPAKTERSTKNFDTMDEALIRKSNDGDVGKIITVPGEVKACRYCPVVGICVQAEGMLASGRLVL
tara:strand:+ start:840 stop:1826 length:987 start_codon:yes stop_codon:yes gene_type:complete